MILYLETGNLVKIYVQEADSAEAAALVAEAEAVGASVVAYPEARAALVRKFREKGISEEDYNRIQEDLDNDWEKFFIIMLTDSLAKFSGDLAEKWSLRGFDAFHLASALELKKALPHPVRFSSSDARPK